MTLIIALNLSDRIYIAGDTRVTFDDGTTKDNALKVLPLIDIAKFPEHSIGVAVAGNVDFAAYLYQEVSAGINNEILSPDIRKLAEQIKEFSEERIINWVNNGGRLDREVCILFAGTFAYRKKEINLDILSRLVHLFEIKTKEDLSKRHLTENALRDDPIFQALNQKLKTESGLGVLEHLDASGVPKIPEYIAKALKNQEIFLDEYVDSLIFSVSINVRSKNVSIEKAEWGDFLAFGSRGITKLDITDYILASLELSRPQTMNDHMMAAAIISATILDIAKEMKIETIGGGVTIGIVKKGEFAISANGLRMGPGVFSIRINNQEVSLIPFTKYIKQDRDYSDAKL